MDALGTYDFTGIQVFNWTITDGPFDAMGLIFSEMTIALIPAPATFVALAPFVAMRRRRRR